MNKLKTLTALFLLTFPAVTFSNSNSYNFATSTEAYNLNLCGATRCDNTTSQQPQRAPREVWQNYYGAIAYDSKAKVAGTSENEKSMADAKRVAIQNCGAGTKCKIVAYARNSCTAIAQDGGITAFGTEPTEATATKEALDNCRSVGGTECEITYSHCSLPVRIQ